MPPKKVTPKSVASKSPGTGKGTAPSTKSSGPSSSKGKGTTAKQKSSPKKSPSKTTVKKTSNDVEKKKQSKVSWTKEDIAAIKLQKNFRILLAKKKLDHQREAKKRYAEEIERLEREAWLEIVKREREEAEKERLKEEEQRRQIKEEAKRKKIILEAAFDGDKEMINNVLEEAKKSDLASLKVTGPVLELKILRHQMALIDCEDANGNTPLSEAAAGGDEESIEFLINKGAAVNTRGAFRRTPLYRAAFGGHLAAVQILLENGADGRLCADDGNSPEQIAASPHVAELISSWDIKETERLMARNEKRKQERLKIEQEHLEKQTKMLSHEIAEVEKLYKVKQRQLQKAYEELNKRIFEHDKCALLDASKKEVTLQAVHDGEEDLEKAKREEKEAREKLSILKLQLREETSHAKDQTDLFAIKGVKCNLKELDDVLMRDVGDKIKNDARYGKFLVIDMMQIDMLEVIESRIEEIEKGLYKILIDKQLLKNDRFLSLVRPSDGSDYKKEKFAISRIDCFKLVFVTSMWQPPEHWLDIFYSIKVVVSSS
ncbi:IQ motif and ankyrin repeat domain-containing protein 1-like isoform X2 [Rhopilema esculentum]|uniref:IQ motif and ankyrin repeat domain-containing protein 1-like isoform X2 n=1 Tax=Rhopilema esculentum TaxID=499914 RepID=UPI0031D11152